MAKDTAIRKYSESPSHLCRFVEDTCGYVLPWGLNSILTYLSMVAVELGESVPPVCSYFAGMVKNGVSDPVAVCVIPYLDQDRLLAMRVASLCPYSFEQADQIVRWFLHVTVEELLALGAKPAVAEAVIQQRNLHKQQPRMSTRRPTDHIDLAVTQSVYEQVDLGEKLLIISRDERDAGDFDVFTLTGLLVGEFRHHKGSFPQWWRDLSLVDTEVQGKEQSSDGRCRLRVTLVGV
jgi:hypothetical protein